MVRQFSHGGYIKRRKLRLLLLVSIVLVLPILPLLRFYLDESLWYYIHNLIVAGTLIYGLVFFVSMVNFLIIKSIQKALLFSSVFVYLSLSYGEFYDLFNSQNWLFEGFGECYTISIFLLFIIALVRMRILAMSKVISLISVAGVITLTLLIFQIMAFANLNSSKFLDKVDFQNFHKPVEVKKTLRAENLPNILYIVLDEYERPNLINKFFDSTVEIESDLESLGFKVFGKSRSNYPLTNYSLSSSLNMGYIDYSRPGKEKSSVWPSLKWSMKNNKLFKLLQLEGYDFNLQNFATFKFVNIESAEDEVEINHINHGFWYRTIYGKIATRLLKHQTEKKVKEHRLEVLNGFSYLSDSLKYDDKSFNYIHILSPHVPFVVGQDSRAISGPYPSLGAGNMTTSEWKNRYVKQTKRINELLVSAIKKVLYKAKGQCIIVIQGDHGARTPAYHGKGDSSNIVGSLLTYANLNAVYFPDQDYSTVYDSMSNVNTWRVVLNKYFGTELELLPDRNFAIDPDDPFKFTDITEKLDSIEKSLK